MPDDNPTQFALPVDADRRPAELRVTDRDWDTLTAHLLAGGEEHAALLVCGVREGGCSRSLLVQEVVALAPEDYLDRGPLHLAVAPTTLARHAKRARARGAALVLAHSHPFRGPVRASTLDLCTEADLCRRVLTSRTGQPSGALVVGPDGVDARLWTPDGAIPLESIVVVGDRVQRLATTSRGVPRRRPSPEYPVTDSPPAGASSATARQELVWGAAGQTTLQRSHVVIVGCGGTGSHVAQQLAHLRVGGITLIDPDVVEESNLSRLIGSTPSDVGRPKVEAVADLIHRVAPAAQVLPLRSSLLDVDPQLYAAADVIVCATDGHGSRSLLTEVAVQYLVPVVDLGVEVDPQASPLRAGGGVRVLRPGHGCLWCAQTLDPALVREEYLSEAERTVESRRGYLRGVDEPAPSVVALNGVVSSLAVLEVCQLLVGMLGGGRTRLLYRAEQRALSTASIAANPDCHVCGISGVLGRGDAHRVKTRWQAAPERGA